MHRSTSTPSAAWHPLWAALMLSVGLAQAQPGPTLPDETAFHRAHRDHEVGRWPQAYAGFAQLADHGHAEAARVALQMWRHGPRLYGQRFDAPAAQRARWSTLHACAVLGSAANDPACSPLALHQPARVP